MDDGPVEPGDLNRMGAALAHRGPDGRRAVVRGAAGLGHCLMRINREDRHEAQPLDEDGIVLVADLRLDNREELARALRIDPTNVSHLPDSALLLAAWRRWGEACVDRLLGDFAFAIHDTRTGRLFLARDPVGMRGLHVHRAKNFLAFATEAKALHALPQVPRSIDHAALLRFLMGGHQAPDASQFEAVDALPGGSALSITGTGAAHLRQWWQPAPAREHRGQKLDYYIATYRALLEEAVACRTRRLIAPPGMLLSGGFDSGAIAGVCRASRLVAVTSCLPESAAGPLLRNDARRGAQWCRDHMPHLDHHWFVRADESFLDHDDRLRHTSDGVPGPGRYVFEAMYNVLAQGGARVAIDGVGGDCSINPRVPYVLPHLLRAGRFGQFASELRAEARASHRTTWRVLRADVLPLLSPSLRRALLSWRGRGGDYWQHPYAETGLRDRLWRDGWLRKAEGVHHTMVLDDLAQRVASVHVLQARARQIGVNEAAAHGLEVLRPMLDRRLIEFGLAIPERFQVKDGRNRQIARRALTGILPPQFQSRPRSQEHLDPALHEVVTAVLPRMRAELEALRGRCGIVTVLDLERMIADTATERGERLSKTQALALARAWSVARYLEWFARDTRPPLDGDLRALVVPRRSASAGLDSSQGEIMLL